MFFHCVSSRLVSLKYVLYNLLFYYLYYLLSFLLFLLLFLQAGNLRFWVLFAKQTVNFSLILFIAFLFSVFRLFLVFLCSLQTVSFVLLCFLLLCKSFSMYFNDFPFYDLPKHLSRRGIHFDQLSLSSVFRLLLEFPKQTYTYPYPLPAFHRGKNVNCMQIRKS